MVKFHTSLLVVTLATGSALASANEFQRRGESDVNNQGPIPNLHLRFGLAMARHNNLLPRGSVDEDDLFVRDDAFDDIEAREPGGGAIKALTGAFKFGKRLAKHKNTKHLKTAVDVGMEGYTGYQMLNSRGLEDDEDLFVRDLEALDDLEAREPGGGAIKAVTDAFKFGKRLAKHKNTKHLMTAADVGMQGYAGYQMLNSRGLEDDEDLFVRDLDALDDLEAREPGGGAIKAATNAFKFGKRLAEHKNTKHLKTAVDVGMQGYAGYQMLNSRGLGDDEDIFVRDLDTEEFFGREYDLLDERDTFDDLD